MKIQTSEPIEIGNTNGALPEFGRVKDVQDLFGVRIGDSGSVTVVPSLPGALAHRIAAARRTIGLEHVEAGGRTLDIALQLPSAWSDTDLLEAAKVSVDGAPLPAGRSLPPGAHRVLVILRANAGHQVPLRVVDAASPLRPTDAERRLTPSPSARTVHDPRGGAIRTTARD